MYEFHYDNIKNKKDSKSKLWFTDTDSLMDEIKTEDVYEDFSSNKKMFDFSNYSTKSKYYDNSLEKWQIDPEVLRLEILLDWSQKCIHC